MRIESSALNVHEGLAPSGHVASPAVIIDFLESEPVLESSYIFPKVESYGGWHFDAPGAVTISEDC